MNFNSTLFLGNKPVVFELLMQVDVLIAHVLFNFSEQSLSLPILEPDFDDTLDPSEPPLGVEQFVEISPSSPSLEIFLDDHCSFSLKISHKNIFFHSLLGVLDHHFIVFNALADFVLRWFAHERGQIDDLIGQELNVSDSIFLHHGLDFENHFLDVTPNVEILALELEKVFRVLLDLPLVYFNSLLLEVTLDDVFRTLSFSEHILSVDPRALAALQVVSS